MSTDNNLKNKINNLSDDQLIKFMNLLETFNHKGGSSSHSKVNRALDVVNHKSNDTVQKGGSLFGGFTNMFGGVTDNLNKLKDMVTPTFLKEIHNEIEHEKMDGGKVETHNTKENRAENQNEKEEELGENVSKLEESISLLNKTLNNMNDNANYVTLNGGGKKKKKSPSSYKKKSKKKKSKKMKSKKTKSKRKSKNKRKRKTQKSTKIE